jgi:carbon monoxide dehydrogenase subunit G
LTLIETVELPGPPARAWDLLAARSGALRLTPGLSVAEDGRGTLRIVIGGHAVTYRGYARQHIEEKGRHLTWTLSGKEVRGTGRAHAEIRARFHDGTDGGTSLRLTVLVDGRGRLAEISASELDRALSSNLARFRRAVAKDLGEVAPVKSAPQAASPSGARTTTPSTPTTRVEVMPPIRTKVRSARPIQAAVGVLVVGVAALVFWRYRSRG